MELSRITRRGVLGAATGLIAAKALPAWAAAGGAQPFTLGVASGDPVPDGFVIWTRLAPEPLAPDGLGGLRAPVPVSWEIAADEGMRHVVQAGHVQADSRFAHSVHVEVAGLKPDRRYWYRFIAMGEQSPVGRARTAPAPGQRVDRLHFAFASCSNWERGYFSAYRHMAEEQPDLVMFLGDYIYEGSLDPALAPGLARRHQTPDPFDLAGYRLRFASYHTDPDLQALHAAAPCLMTWDDHEVENDYSNQWSEWPKTDPAAFLKRRAASYRAYYEHMPLRRRSIPRGPDMRVYDRFRWGDLAEFHVLDGRQYRTAMQACPTAEFRGGHQVGSDCAERTDPRRSMLGWAQEAWLFDGLKRSKAPWTILAQDLLVAQAVAKAPGTSAPLWRTDAWDGYASTRARVLDAITANRVSNPVFLSGDAHIFFVNDMKQRWGDPSSPVVATEFLGTSITSDGADPASIQPVLDANPDIRFFEPRYRGYVSMTLSRDRLDTRFRVISDRTDPKASISTLKTFVMESGKAGAVPA